MNFREAIDREVKQMTPKGLLDHVKNNRGSHVIYDIETTPLSDREILGYADEKKLKLPKYPGAFDASKVKYGNAKSPEAKDSKLKAAQERHRIALREYNDKYQESLQKFKDEATLKPSMSKVLAIGYGLVDMVQDEVIFCLDVDEKNERNLIRRHWLITEALKGSMGTLISFNGHGFDYPYLVRRSWAYEDIDPPRYKNKFKSMEEWCVDLMEEYSLKCYGSSHSISLNDLSMMMGFGGKPDGMTGDEFHEVWKRDPEMALDYLAWDVERPYLIAKRMRIF